MKEQIKREILLFFYKIIHPIAYKKMMREMDKIIDTTIERAYGDKKLF